uniref:Uncharacterized protein n=1 Tax=Meloidogyne enterolobii TaxID=390850 RepID=A0A6V7YA79_MELEN|nr:unnamed protein product [Meloidogyne enterolobii]
MQQAMDESGRMFLAQQGRARGPIIQEPTDQEHSTFHGHGMSTGNRNGKGIQIDLNEDPKGKGKQIVLNEDPETDSD